MTRLADEYVAARAGSDPDPASRVSATLPEPEAHSLEAVLGALLERGAQAHPDLSLDGVMFAAHLGRCGAPVDVRSRTAVHAEDLSGRRRLAGK